MAKSSFSLKLITLTQKTVKFDQKLSNICDMKMRSNLTTKRGDSGSAGMLEKNSVMNQAPKFDTIIDQKVSPT